MASYFSYPGYAPPQPYAQTPDISGDFFRSLQQGQNVRNEYDAENTLSQLAAKLGVRPQTMPGAQPSLMDLGQQPSQVNANGAQNLGDLSTLASPAERAAGIGPDYYARIAQSESGGNPTATNPNSTARGTYQILDGTAADIQKNHPDLGLTGDWRNDPAQSLTGYQAFTGDNAKVLSRAGVPVNPGNLYLGAYFGGQGAVDLLKLPDNTPMVAAVSADVISANPSLANQTVGDVKAWATSKAGNGQGGYQAPPMQPQAAPQSGPSQEQIAALLSNPVTRQIGLTYLQRQTDPNYALDIQGKQAEIALKTAQANAWSGQGGKLPTGYMRDANGNVTFIPGANADPANPLNYGKVNPFGQPIAPDGSGGAQAADAVPVGLGPDGKPDPQQQAAYIQTLPPGLQQIVPGVVNYTLDPNKVVSIKGNARTQVIAAAKAADPTFDMAQYPARAAMVKSLASGPMQQTLSSVNTTIQHLGELDNQVDTLHNSGFTPWNGIAQSVSAATGHQEPITFEQTAQAAANEMAKFFKGTGVTDVQSINDWQKAVSSSNSPDQLHAAIRNAIGNLMQAKLNTLQEQYKATMGGGTLPGFLSSQSLATLQKLGIDPASLDPAVQAGAGPAGGMPQGQPDNAPMQTAVNPQTGERIQLVNGQWVPLK